MSAHYFCPKCGCQLTEGSNGVLYRPKVAPDSVAEDYLAGATSIQLTAKYNLPWKTIRSKLVLMGVEIRPKGMPTGNVLNGVRKTKADDRRKIGELHMRGVHHAEIGKSFNITRERVRQIVALLQLPPRSEAVTKRVAEKITAKAEEKVERAQMNRAQIEAASELWKNGEHHTVIGEVLGCATPHDTMQRITWLRKKHPRMFPYRRPNHWNRRVTSKSAKTPQ